ncbi:S-adenosylmethionine decarboxylase proenzyme 4-like [Asparagus officinalis]|uniref:S-adenosylmethionine decarboxylase proenzyme 4-like n=1 Tax=Asparagus officinalis TaxID=4686 RepID=UPI00098E2CAB|nr:S-adenosylmethionine decarboxylase proenzyme 4-like [Asparagus officinalis]
MSVSGFEGFEKRLELRFFGDDPLGLRRLPISTINQVLTPCNAPLCPDELGTAAFDAYTQLLKGHPCPFYLTLWPLVSACRSLGILGLVHVSPDSQPSPHSCFADEVTYLERFLPSDLRHRKACILPSNGRHSWHVFSASVFDEGIQVLDELTVEVCMTDLDRELASGFYRKKADHSLSGDEVGRAMTQSTGIDGINPRSLVCGFAFEPCGYSMNSLDGDFYSRSSRSE